MNPGALIKKAYKEMDKGAAMLISVLFFLSISIIVVIGFSGPLAKETALAQELTSSKKTYYLAESGVEDAFYRLKNDMEISSVETLSLNGGTATITLIDTSDGKEITSASDVNSLFRNVKIVASTSVVDVEFDFGAQAGAGGLSMTNNALIQGTGGATGNVYSNGPVVGSNNVDIDGDVTVGGSLTEDMTARSIICNQDQIVGKNNADEDYTQSFQASATDTLAKISLYIKKNGDLDSRTVYITTDASGEPAQTSIGSGTLDKNNTGTSYGWVDIVLDSPVALTSGQTYWIVLDANRHNSKYWVWCKDSGAGYANGEVKYSQEWDNSEPWYASSGDLTFRTFLGAGVNSIDDIDITGTARANTITDSLVNGDAYYQTISDSSVGGTSYPGSTDPPLISMPISDAEILAWEADAAAGGVINGDCPGTTGCSDTMGPVQVNGDFTLTNNAELTLTGVIHVTGDINISNNADIRCDSSFGPNSCVFLSDGAIDVSNNVIFDGSGHPDSFILLLTDIAGCTGDVGGSQCAAGNSGLHLSNNALGAIFYAANSLVRLDNNADVTTVVGYRIEMENNATITYETAVSDLDFLSSGSGGSTDSWKLNSWREVE